MRINDNVINTIKFIGQTEWRLAEAGVDYKLFPRWMIKQWVFTNHQKMCAIEIGKKIDYAAARDVKKHGPDAPLRKRSCTFVYVDDRIVEKAMKLQWKIEKPKVGQQTAFGLKTHSWQGLAMATFYIEQHDPSFLAKEASD